MYMDLNRIAIRVYNASKRKFGGRYVNEGNCLVA